MSDFDKSKIEILEEFRKGYVKWYKCKCPEHGIFEKRKADFLKSEYGCQKCGANKSNEKRYKKQYSSFLKQAKEIHGDKYIYPDNIKTYYNNDKINIFCKKHNEYFLQEIGYHLNGSGCPKCGLENSIDSKRLTTEEIVSNCIEKRGKENYDYSKVVWKDSSENIDIICRKHGLFSTRYYDFIRGINCPECAKEIAKEKIKKTLSEKGKAVIFNNEEFINKAKKVSPEFDYSKTVFNGRNKSVIVIHDGVEYPILAKNLLKGSKPFKLSIAERGVKKAQNRWKNIEDELKKIHKNKYEYSKEEIDFIKSGKANRNFILHINCKRHGVFEQTFFDHRCGSGCKLCGIENRPIINVSNAEKEIVKYIKTFYNDEIISNDKKILKGKELDIYIPKLNLAFEYDGLFWHNNIDNSYKFKKCRENGIRLIRISEPEWLRENNKIKYFLKSTFGIFEKKIFARKCEIKEIDIETYKTFCEENHLQGYSPASIKLGLFFEKELVQIESYGKSRFNNKFEWELIRECSKLGYSVIGGKEKLLKYFERKYSPKNILSYCEKDKFSGKSYYKNGFKLIGESQPNYTYYYKKDYTPLSRFNFQKHKLKEKLEVFNEELTEWENMSNNGYKRLFDYGNYIFVKELTNI